MDKFNAINEAICYWMGYQFKIGRERLIHEASLRYPIADTITAKGIEINRIYLEKGHPYFSDRRVDIIVFNKDYQTISKENFIEEIDEIYELKIAKRDSDTKFGAENQRIIDDILRLAYFNRYSQKNSFFLLCGKYQDFKNYFVGYKDKLDRDIDNHIIIKEKFSAEVNNNIEWNIENSLYKDYFDFRIGVSKEFRFNVNEIPENISTSDKNQLEFGLNSFQNTYKIKDNNIVYESSIKIKTTCISITPFERTTNRTHACGIWKIEGII